MNSIKIVLLTCCCLVANTLNAQAASDYSKWDHKNGPSDYMENRAWREQRQKTVPGLTVLLREDTKLPAGQYVYVPIPLENGEFKKGVLEHFVQATFSGSRKIWLNDDLGCSPGFLRSLSDELMDLCRIISHCIDIYVDPKSDAAITNFEIDPSIIKKSLHFYKALQQKDDVEAEKIVGLKNSVVSFVRHIQPISEEDGTFEAVYDESPYKIFSKENDALRRSAFYPITREDMMSVADVCLNEVSPFDEDEKEEIRQAFVEKGFLSA